MSDLLSEYGSSSERVERALAALQQGRGVVLVDDADRENEGDLIFPAASLQSEQMAQMIRFGSGIVCLCLTNAHADRLALPPMVTANESRYRTGFTVSIEAKHGVTTGVSAHDRTVTVRAAVIEDAAADDLARPGHVFPLRAQDGGVLERRGHTEGTVDLMRLAGLTPCGVLCELMNDDGTMMQLESLKVFASERAYPLLAIEDLVAYRRAAISAKARELTA
ncbi:3,4-dihydroxy-2-butanone-4-phosphate synthase [Phytohalomonas tamaricis]|uniref:3,4-dihydroxy-2-butanone-4-phosphate synthase n=1 Tax=Phytohalomonas tamaricis TaxID=2081032 RepID=UPI000D0B9EF7|nr:3,4-dihydroxy-2-butanone-4-phosphate synthase [Phytohalomonas tamaricis]